MRNELRQVDENRGEEHSLLTEVTIGQGRYVVPFTLSREEEAVGMELGRSNLTQLMTECAASSFESKDESSWARVKKTRKNSTKVILWEKYSKREFKKKKQRSTVPSRLAAMNMEEDSGPVTYSVRSSTTVNAPLDTVLKTLDASVATAYRSFTSIIYGNLVADTSVLFLSSTSRTSFLAESETDSYETLAVRWLVCRCSNLMVSDCDFCLQEYTKRHSIGELTTNGDRCIKNKSRDDHDSNATYDRIKHDGGHEGLHAVDELPVAYKTFRSMKTRHCPESLEPHRVVRCKVPLGGFLLYPTDSSDKTAVVFYMSIAHDAGGDRDNRSRNSVLSNAMLTQCSKWQFRALRSVARQMALQIGRLNNAVESYNIILHLNSLRTLQWVCNAERIQCVVCCRSFHLLTRRRHHCRVCGEVICRDCSVHKDVGLPTVGPTLLRICTNCNQTHSSTRLKASIRSELEEVSVSPQNPPTRRASLTTDHATEKLKLVPVTLSKAPIAQRRTRQGATATSKAPSCPKLAQSAAFDRRYIAKKCGTRVISTKKTSPFTTAPDSPKPARVLSIKGTLYRSSSETFSASPYRQPPVPDNYFQSPVTMRICSRSKPPGVHTNATDKNKVESLTTHADNDGFKSRGRKCQRNSSFTRARQIYPSKYCSNNGNQQSVSSMATGGVSSLTRQQDRQWIDRNVETPQMYEDIFLKLCETAASVRNSKFVALTLFTRKAQADKDDVELGMSTIYYLKVKGSAKLMKVAANLRCCDPVLQMQKPLITRNTWALDGKSALHPSGYNFRQLPIVHGPQQARFYAGVPLTDTKKRYRYGALAVFDSKISPGQDDDLPMKKTLQALQVCACEAVMAVDARKKEIELRVFLQAPLIQLRQSEPALHHSMDNSQTSQQWRKIESIDGDSDDNNSNNEDNQHHECKVRNGSPELLNNGNSSVGKARVDYFQSKMQELVRQAQDTQAQMVENTHTTKRHGVPSI